MFKGNLILDEHWHLGFKVTLILNPNHTDRETTTALPYYTNNRYNTSIIVMNETHYAHKGVCVGCVSIVCVN